MEQKVDTFLKSINESIVANIFVSITLGNYKGIIEQLKNIYIKKISSKGEEKLSFTYRYKTNDIIKNFTAKEAINEIENHLKEGFKFANLFTIE